MQYVVCDIECRDASGNVEQIDTDRRLRIDTTKIGDILSNNRVNYVVIGGPKDTYVKYTKKRIEG